MTFAQTEIRFCKAKTTVVAVRTLSEAVEIGMRFAAGFTQLAVCEEDSWSGCSKRIKENEGG